MKIIKYLGYFAILLVTTIGVVLAYVKAALPDVGEAENLTIEYTPERMARGKYLANSVTLCMDCHSKRDWTKFSGPLVDGTLGQGGERFDETLGLPGVFISRNITPEGIGRYTDGELYRVITTGVNKEGRAMFPLMPFLYYGKMDPEDIYSIITYVRSIEPIQHEVDPSAPNLPMSFIINTIPQKAQPQKRPDKSDVLAYGAYLVNAAGCVECHTQINNGRIIEEVSFAGGREFPFADGSVVRSANITPDKETGIGAWPEEMFVNKFKAFADSTYMAEKVNPGEFNSYMPWRMFARMEREDLVAVYRYLHSLKPISNKVEKFTSANKM